MIDENLRYLSTHEWARREADVVTAGLSAHAVAQLGDIVYLELPKVGASVKKEQPFGVIESVKAASDLYAPVSGAVSEVNEKLGDTLDLFQSDTYGAAWLIKIKMSDPAQYDTLMEAAAYKNHIAPEET